MASDEDKDTVADPASPMTKHDKIDLISVDEKTDRVILSMIETRAWGDRGGNIRDLHEKLNTYLNYVIGGQIWSDYPPMRGKRVAFRLHAAFPLTDKEEHYILVVREKFLNAQNIGWETTVL
jgi:hypothetical protein